MSASKLLFISKRCFSLCLYSRYWRKPIKLMNWVFIMQFGLKFWESICTFVSTWDSFTNIFCPSYAYKISMMTSSNGEIFCVTGPLCGEFTVHRWIPLTKASDAELWFFSLICAWTKNWVNNGDAGDLRRHYTHYEVTVTQNESNTNRSCCLATITEVSILVPSHRCEIIAPHFKWNLLVPDPHMSCRHLT